MTEVPIDQIIEKLRDLDLKDVLKFLVANKIVNFSQEKYSKIKKFIQNKTLERKYLFVPIKTEAELLKKLSLEGKYRKVLLLIPNYKYIDLIRTGLLINYYHNADTLENRERVYEIKRQISNRPNGKKLLKIVNLPTVTHFHSIMEVLLEYKSQGYSDMVLEERFEELVNEWETASLFVEAKYTEQYIKEFYLEHIKNRSPYFFLLGMKSAGNKVMNIFKEIEELNLLKENNYIAKITKIPTGNRPRVEILFLLKEE